MNKGVVIASLYSVYSYLNNKEKKEAIYQFLLLLLSSILDVGGLASIMPILMLASNPEKINNIRYLSDVYNLLGFDSPKGFLIFLIIGVFFFFLVKNLFTTWINYKQVKFTARIAIKIIKVQYNKYLNLPYWEFNSIGSAELMNSIYHNPNIYVVGVIRPLFILFSDLIMIGVIILGILFYQPLLVVLLALILIPSTLLTYNALKNKSAEVGIRTNALRPITYSLILNSFNGFVEYKLANKIDENKEVFLTKQKEVQSLEATGYLLNNIPLKIIEMVAVLGIVTIFLYSILFPQYSANLVTLVGLFAAAAYRLMPSVNRIITAIIMLKQNQYLIPLLNKYQEFSKRIPVSKETLPLTFNNLIRFDNITFSFPGSGKEVVKNINIEVKKGEKVGFIGASGSGKTTLMNILLRFYIENKGKILVDGVPLTDQNIASWYNLIGYVKQDTFLMEGTIKDNITLGATVVDEEKLYFALQYSSLTDFVDTLPEKVNTEIGERGSRLSGGQKQRIGIARALYKNAEILVLDEATSALDTNTEKEVSEAINNLSKTNITIFMIAHRITTLKECDRIYELKDSEIVAEWNYNDLIQTVI